MKRVVNGRMYDTETAELVGDRTADASDGDGYLGTVRTRYYLSPGGHVFCTFQNVAASGNWLKRRWATPAEPEPHSLILRGSTEQACDHMALDLGISVDEAIRRLGINVPAG